MLGLGFGEAPLFTECHTLDKHVAAVDSGRLLASPVSPVQSVLASRSCYDQVTPTVSKGRCSDFGTPRAIHKSQSFSRSRSGSKTAYNG